jgi:hypothetical protein
LTWRTKNNTPLKNHFQYVFGSFSKISLKINAEQFFEKSLVREGLMSFAKRYFFREWPPSPNDMSSPQAGKFNESLESVEQSRKISPSKSD